MRAKSQCECITLAFCFGEIEMTLTTYEFYRDEYYGVAVSDVEFPRYQNMASYKLAWLSNYAISEETLLGEYNEEVQRATCALIDVLSRIDKAQTTAEAGAVASNIKSMSSGGESISYGTATTSIMAALASEKDKNALLFDTVREYLGGTGLLYQGL